MVIVSTGWRCALLSAALLLALAFAPAADVQAGEMPAYGPSRNPGEPSEPSEPPRTGGGSERVISNCGPNQIQTRSGGCACGRGYENVDGACMKLEKPKKPKPEKPKKPKPEKPKKPKPEKPKKPKPEKPKPVVVPLQPEPPPPMSKPLGIALYDLSGTPCLDGDLHRLLTGTYGPRPDLAACATGCVPRPKANLLPLAVLDARMAGAGLSWCPDDCIALSSYLPAEEILRLEDMTGRSFCSADAALLCRMAESSDLGTAEVRERVRVILRDRPVAQPRPGDLAIVAGIADYDGGIADKPASARDAAAVSDLLVEKLGYGQANVIAAGGVTAGDLAGLFAANGRLGRRADGGNLFVYLSARGFADPTTGEAFLLGADASLADPSTGRLPLQAFYEAIAASGARSATVVLEVDFSTSIGSLVAPPNLPETDVAVLPERAIPGLLVFTAADRDQHTLADPEVGTSLFTRHVLEGLSGAADAAPIGNGDRRIEAVELYVYTSHRVRVSARKAFGLEQRPLMSQAPNALISGF